MASAQGAPNNEEELGKGDRSPLCACFHASFLPLVPTGHRRTLEEGIQPQPPDPAPDAPPRDAGLGGKGPARAPRGVREDAGSAGTAVRYAVSCAPIRAWGSGVGGGKDQATLLALPPTSCKMCIRSRSLIFLFYEVKLHLSLRHRSVVWI